jgi:Domain of unknown function(DUF2779)
LLSTTGLRILETLHCRQAKRLGFFIPRLSSVSFDNLELSDVVPMKDVPDNFPLDPKQRRVVLAAKSGKVIRSPKLAEMLESLTPPASYLDFETFSPAIPIYADTRPYERIPFQPKSGS